MDEKVFYREISTTRPMELNCPYCRSVETYELNWRVRLRKDQVPQGADERDRARFAKAMSYMVLVDDKVSCKHPGCSRAFDVSGIKTMAFLSPDLEETIRREAPAPKQKDRRGFGQQKRSGQQRYQGQGQGQGQGQNQGQNKQRRKRPRGDFQRGFGNRY